MRGYVFDANGKMVSDNGGSEINQKEHIVARVRGWGHIQKLPDAAKLQDEFGAIIAQALNTYYELVQAAANQSRPSFTISSNLPTPKDTSCC
jgi:hypothetical protein